jgi:L-2-hydroxyglutarate oxidase
VAKYQTDFLVIGGGIIGISIGRRLKMLYPEMAVSLLEKEAAVGFHASGRNSGVLHVGFFTPSIV